MRTVNPAAVREEIQHLPPALKRNESIRYEVDAKNEVGTGPGKEGHSTDDGDEAYPLLQLFYQLLI